jgi:RNA polymerase sigma-70 factor, ECF subfamily
MYEKASAPATLESQGPSEVADEVLLLRVAQRDQEALGILFRRYARIALNIGRKILRDGEEAEDLVQDIFLYLHRKCGVYDATRGPASSWIVQTIYYQALQRKIRLATRNRRSAQVSENGRRGAATPSTAIEYDQSLEGLIGRAKLREIVDCLTEDQLETLRLHFFEGHTLSEIAEMRGQSVGNVRHHFYRGIEKLRSRIFGSELQDRIASDTR